MHDADRLGACWSPIGGSVGVRDSARKEMDDERMSTQWYDDTLARPLLSTFLLSVFRSPCRCIIGAVCLRTADACLTHDSTPNAELHASSHSLNHDEIQSHARNMCTSCMSFT